MKNYLFFSSILLFILFTACGPVDKSNNSTDNLNTLVCFNLHENAGFTQSEKDAAFAGCLIYMKQTHNKRVNRDGGLDCWKCHKSL
jgi:hypothetical protein